MIDGFIRASSGYRRPYSVGGGDNFVHVEHLVAKLETRTDPLMVSPNAALRPTEKHSRFSRVLRDHGDVGLVSSESHILGRPSEVM